MQRQQLASRGVITLILILQFIPLILFPPSSFSPATQEWWLPVLLAIMVIVSDVELIVRGSIEVWPWDLGAFAQGFNIISRLMMLWPHATIMVKGNQVINTPYVALTLISIALSVFMLWYAALPEVRIGLVRHASSGS